MADGITSLATLNWGASTGGAAGSGETTTTLGVDRQDSRTPPDLTRVWAAQINANKNLLLSMSAFFKGGTRLQVLTQTSNPFGVSESGYYIDTTGKFWGVYNGTPTQLTGGGGSTGNWTFSGNIADLSGAGAMQLGNTNATSVKLIPSTLNFPSAMSMAATAQGATNTTGMTIAPNVADGASSINLVLNGTTSLANASAKLLSIQNAGSEKVFVDPSGNVGVHSVLNSGLTYGIKLFNAFVEVTGGALAPDLTDTRNLGGTSNYWLGTYSDAYITKPQANTVGATFTINPANASYVKQTLTSATNVTAVTISAGIDGQELIVEIIQPAAGTACTVVTTWTNVAFANGAGSFTNTLGKRDIYTFIYNSTTSKWNEVGRAVNVS